MTSLLTAFLLVLLFPLVVASWRVSLLGLGLQGLLMAAMVASRWPETHAPTAILLMDLTVVRGLIVPFALYRVGRSQNRPARNDVIPPNLLSWAITAALVGLGFRCGRWLHPGDGVEGVHVAVAAVGVLLGMFVLATQNGTFSQAIGALRVENAIALFELGAPAHLPIGLQAAQAVVFLATALTYVFYVKRLSPLAVPRPERPSS